MSTFTQIMYHIVFSTKNREKTLVKEQRPELYKYMWGIIKQKQCHLYRLNGIEDHVHILTHLHPAESLSNLIKDIKVASSIFIKEQKLFKGFSGWQSGYAAFTLALSEKDSLIEYIKGQEEHHQNETFEDEYRRLLKDQGIDFEDKYLF